MNKLLEERSCALEVRFEESLSEQRIKQQVLTRQTLNILNFENFISNYRRVICLFMQVQSLIRELSGTVENIKCSLCQETTLII